MSNLTPESTEARDDGAFSIDIRVYYEDTDAAGVVYYANYLRFMERARSDWLRALDITMDVASTDIANSGQAARRERALEQSLVTATGSSEDVSSDTPSVGGASPIFVVRRAEIDYGMPARLNDLLRVDVRLDDESLERRLRGAAFWLRQSVTRLGATDDASDQVLVRGRVQVASIDPLSFRPRRLPVWVVERVLASVA